MAELRPALDERVVAANLARIEGELATAHAAAPGGRAAPRVLAAVKYLADEQLPALAAAGVQLVGENRAQQLAARHAAYGELFEWHFIGRLQSRKVAGIAQHVTVIESLASDSALAALSRVRERATPALRLLIEVNVSGEDGKEGIAPGELDRYLAAAPFAVAGLMTMPPLSEDPELSRPYFAALRELADARGLAELSMGTSQDYVVAAQEGATIVRIGTRLYDPPRPA